jgi:amino acid adenylation domain-containing protein
MQTRADIDAPPPEVETIPPVTDLFLHAARLHPQATAVCDRTQSLSYAQLDEHSGYLADRLQAHGIRSGDIVGVTGATVSSVAALLGVLRAGAVMLPLDPALPPDRRTALLDLAQAAAIVDPDTDGNWRITLRASASARKPATGPASSGQSGMEHAYVFATSGSTGTPKVILSRHRGLSHFTRWQRDTFAIGPGDRIGQIANWTFEVVIREVFTPLISGATVCLPDTRSVEAHRIFPFAREHGITILHVVPTLVRRWLRDPSADLSLPTLRTTFFAGEPLHADVAHAWRRKTAAAATVINLYGPTETTLAKCHYPVPDGAPPGLLPVGTPLPGCDVAIMTPGSWQPCPDGEIGEIVIRTPYRSAGYLGVNQTDTFPVNPFTDNPADRVYRTGDLGRIDGQGQLWVQGRIDDQVKVRGVRLTLGAIEDVIQSMRGVSQAKVIDSHAPDGNIVLTAFVVSDGPHGPDGPTIRRTVAAHLPSAAVPTAIHTVDQIPLLPGGKTDRVLLREQAQDLTASAPAQGPSSIAQHPTPLLSLIIEACHQAAPDIGPLAPDDDLTAAGIDSLLLLEIAVRLGKALNQEIRLDIVFDSLTPRDMAARLDGTTSSPSALPEP